MNTKAIIAAALLWAISVGAEAQIPDMGLSNRMVPYCRAFLANKNDVGSGVCAGLVAAGLGYARLLKPPFAFCPPQSVTNGQAIEVVIRYFDKYPEYKNMDFQTLTLVALQSAWPCETKK